MKPSAATGHPSRSSRTGIPEFSLLAACLAVTLVATTPSALAIPTDDPGSKRFQHQWYLEAIGAGGLADKGIDGQGVVVAVLDSGINHAHPDLAGAIWQNEDEVPGNMEDDDGNGYEDDVAGWDMCNRGPARGWSGLDHGTFMAGAIAADGRTHDGILGVAPAVHIMDVQVYCDDNEYPNRDGPLDALAPDALREGLAYAIDNGAHIIVMSLQGWNDAGQAQTDQLLAVQEEFERASQAGILIVAAAGNQGELGPDSPADQPGVLSVGSDTGCDIRHSFSNHGPDVDIWAPGRILSTSHDGYGWDFGTSFATPLVAGAVALLVQDQGVNGTQAGQLLLEAARPSEEGPALDLTSLFGTKHPEAPGALQVEGGTTVGTPYYLQFSAPTPAPLIYVETPGGGKWCLPTTEDSHLRLNPENFARDFEVTARLHTGANAGPWVKTTFRYDPAADPQEERPVFVTSDDSGPPNGGPTPGPGIALIVILPLAAAMRRARRRSAGR